MDQGDRMVLSSLPQNPVALKEAEKEWRLLQKVQFRLKISQTILTIRMSTAQVLRADIQTPMVHGARNSEPRWIQSMHGLRILKHIRNFFQTESILIKLFQTT